MVYIVWNIFYKNIHYPNLNFILGIIEEEAVYIRYVTNGEPITKFASIEAPVTVDASGILKSIQIAIASLNNENEYLRIFKSSL